MRRTAHLLPPGRVRLAAREGSSARLFAQGLHRPLLAVAEHRVYFSPSLPVSFDIDCITAFLPCQALLPGAFGPLPGGDCF